MLKLPNGIRGVSEVCGVAKSIRLSYPFSFCPVSDSALASMDFLLPLPPPASIAKRKCKRWIASANSQTHGNYLAKSEETQILRTSRAHKAELRPLISVCYAFQISSPTKREYKPLGARVISRTLGSYPEHSEELPMLRASRTLKDLQRLPFWLCFTFTY